MSDSDAKEISVSLLDQLIGPQAKAVGVRLWDGTPWPDATPREQYPGAKESGRIAGHAATRDRSGAGRGLSLR